MSDVEDERRVLYARAIKSNLALTQRVMDLEMEIDRLREELNTMREQQCLPTDCDHEWRINTGGSFCPKCGATRTSKETDE